MLQLSVKRGRDPVLFDLNSLQFSRIYFISFLNGVIVDDDDVDDDGDEDFFSSSTCSSSLVSLILMVLHNI